MRKLRCSSKRSGGSVCERSLIHPRTPNGAPTNPSWMSADDSSLIAAPLKLYKWPSGSLFAEAGEQILDPVGHVRALGYPMFDSSDVQAQLDFGAACNGIEKAHALEAGAALALAAVGHHYVIERGLLAAASGQTNRHHLDIPCNA